MEKLKNLGLTIAEKFNVIVERAKTDKKFLGILIGAAVAVVAIIIAIVVALGGSGSQGTGGKPNSGSGNKVTYTVSVQTKGGMILSDISVRVYNDEKLTDLALPNDEDFNNLKFSIAQNSNIYLRCPDSENTNNPRKYFFRFQIELKENMVLNALLGSDAPFTLYCNKNEIMRHYATNPIVKDKFAAKIDLPAGRHEFIVVFSSNNNQGWGFCCKFIRLDGKTAPKVLKPDEFI